MDLIKQVCTLEQAKKLGELLGHNRTAYVWLRADHYPAIVIPEYYNEHAPDYEWSASCGTIHEELNAYTVAELGVMMPPHSDYKEGLDKRPFIEYYPHTHKEEWKAYNPFTKYGSEKIVFEVNTEAEARAAMLIWLLENNHTTPEEVNTRLNQ